MPIDNDNDPVPMYLREVANVQPLTKDEETALFEELRRAGIRKAQLRKDSLEPSVSIAPVGTRGECLHLEEVATRRLIEGHLQAVVDIAEKYSSSGVPKLELLQEGNIGLMKAIDRFAEHPTGEFREFAATLIEEAIRACISQWE